MTDFAPSPDALVKGTTPDADELAKAAFMASFARALDDVVDRPDTIKILGWGDFLHSTRVLSWLP